MVLDNKISEAIIIALMAGFCSSVSESEELWVIMARHRDGKTIISPFVSYLGLPLLGVSNLFRANFWPRN